MAEWILDRKVNDIGTKIYEINELHSHTQKRIFSPGVRPCILYVFGVAKPESEDR